MADHSWEYAGVQLSIDSYVIPVEKLSPTPSRIDGLDFEIENDLRYLGCELIQDAGLLLKLPQVAMATAQVLYQRFFFSKSYVRYVYEHYAMACVFLAAKIEENPRRIRDIINVFHHIKQARDNKPFTPVMIDQAYANLKNHVIKAERRVLKELGFCVHGKHPHKLVILYMQSLDIASDPNLVQIAWNYMNDVLRTDVFVRHSPEAVACSCIFLAARKLGVPLPRHPPWWEMFNVDEESVHEIAVCIQRLYARQKPNINDLEFRLSELRRKQAEVKEAAAATSLALKNAKDRSNEFSSGNPSPATNMDNQIPSNGDNSKGASLSDINQKNITEKNVSSKDPAHRVPNEDPKIDVTNLDTENGELRLGNKENDSISSKYRKEPRRPIAYSQNDSRLDKKRKNRHRSRSPLLKKTNSKSHIHRHASDSDTDYSEESKSPKNRYSRNHRKESNRREVDYRKQSPIEKGSIKRKTSRHMRYRSRSQSSQSSLSSESERSYLQRNKSPPSKPTSYREDYEKVRKDLDRSKKSKPSNGISSSSSTKRDNHSSGSRSRIRQ